MSAPTVADIEATFNPSRGQFDPGTLRRFQEAACTLDEATRKRLTVELTEMGQRAVGQSRDKAREIINQLARCVAALMCAGRPGGSFDTGDKRRADASRLLGF